MFLDEKRLLLTAGRGGDGASLFHREKFVAKGGPIGGDGGRGGSIFLEGRNNLHALAHLSFTEKFKADDGDKGGKTRSSGKSGEDLYIQVPLGTVVSVKSDHAYEEFIDITEDGQIVLIAKGGNGGWGNWHFKSSINQAPDRFNEGLPGEEKKVKLTLKLIADVGLIGLPNAGKSTLLSVISSATPKIANYPFTTLEPQLGVVRFDRKTEDTMIVADLPGLIEGASQGKGLGSKFLKHVERTRVMVHLVDAGLGADEIIKNYLAIRQELKSWSDNLYAKPEIVVLSKIETVDPIELKKIQKKVEKKIGKAVLLISAPVHLGIDELLTQCQKMLY